MSEQSDAIDCLDYGHRWSEWVVHGLRRTRACRRCLKTESEAT